MDDAPRVLVVDDERKICELLKLLLGKDGYEVDSAGDGPSALRLLRKGPYDLVITDVKMPGMDGFELVERVRGVQRDIPLVVITGYATLGTAIQALRQGVDDYVTKPFRLAEMRKVVSRVLEKARLSRENQRLIRDLETANTELVQHREALTERVRTADEDLSRAYTDLQRRVQEMEMLNEVGRCASSELDLDRLLQSCAALVAQKLAVQRD